MEILVTGLFVGFALCFFIGVPIGCYYLFSRQKNVVTGGLSYSYGSL